MNNFDDIFESPKTRNGQLDQPFDKDAWAERKQAQRREVYEMADTIAGEIMRDGNLYREYLDVQAQFDRYSATNALLIFAQMPEATRLKDFEGWKDSGVSIRRGEDSISLLEPGKEYVREDGSVGTSYNVKKVFDISQTTNRARVRPPAQVEERMLLKALIARAPVPLQTAEEIPGNMGAYYDHAQQVIFVRKGMDAPDLFRSVSNELAHAELAGIDREYGREKAGFVAYSASYLLCKKYGIDVSGYRFDQAAAHFTGKSPQEVREELSQIRDTAGSILGRMSRALEQDRTPKAKEQER